MSTKAQKKKVNKSWYRSNLAQYLGIFLFGFLLYANTLGHNFTQDDAIVIYDNQYTKQGLQGIGDIFTKDTFAGFFGEEGKSNLVAGGRYRPLTPAFFAVIHQFFGLSTTAYHLAVVLIYALLGIVILLVGREVDYPAKVDNRSAIALIVAAVFISHPIHTEAVANVKGLDEVFTLLWSLLSMYFTISYTKRGSTWSLLVGAILFFMAMMSKENAAPFVVLIPLTLYGFLKQPRIKRIWSVTAILVATFLIYVFIRGQVIGWQFGDAPLEMMNNPFIKLEDNRYVLMNTGERVASIIYGMGKYLQLLFFPHPLTHDYYPRVFGLVQLSDPAVIMSILMNLALVAIAAIGLRKRSVVTYCIIWFYATIALMSNIVFPIGTHLSERFLFAPSMSLAILVGYGYHRCATGRLRQYRNLLLGILILLFSVKTITRNQVWQSDFRLFTTDVNISKNSAKVRNAAGGSLVDAAYAETDPIKQKEMLETAIEHLNVATDIHPNYKNAYLLKGNAYTYLKQYDEAIAAYDMGLKIDPYYDEIAGNLLIVLKEGARYAGEQLKDLPKSINYLSRALSLAPQDYSANSLMGVAQGSTGNHRAAIKYFEKAIQINPEIARAYVNLGYAQLNMGEEDEAQINFQRAVEIDPKAMDK